ncbi:MAG: hypothetical protein AAGJ18_11440 [Bacteroidota bacterium]
MIKNILLPLFLLSWNLTAAQDLTLIDAMNKVSHQRMLTQKMLNCYFKIGMGTDVDSARVTMEESAATFEESMIELMDFSSTEKITKAIEDVQNAWHIYSLKVLSFPNKTMGSVLFNRSGDIIEDYDNLLKLLAKEVDSEPGRLVNLSGKQGMLAQRIQTIHLAQSWELPKKSVNKQHKAVKADFEETLETLLSAELNQPLILEFLNETATDWKFVKRKFSIPAMSSSIIKTTEKMLQQMEETTKLYTELATTGTILEKAEKDTESKGNNKAKNKATEETKDKAENKADEKVETKAETTTEDKVATKEENEGEVKTDTEVEAETKADTKVVTKTETKKKVEEKVEAETETKTDDKVEEKVEAKTETKADDKVEEKVEAKTETKTDDKVEEKVEAKTETKADDKVEEKAEETTETKAKVEGKTDKDIVASNEGKKDGEGSKQK